jgi:hypothetical protein
MVTPPPTLELPFLSLLTAERKNMVDRERSHRNRVAPCCSQSPVPWSILSSRQDREAHLSRICHPTHSAASFSFIQELAHKFPERVPGKTLGRHGPNTAGVENGWR